LPPQSLYPRYAITEDEGYRRETSQLACPLRNRAEFLGIVQAADEGAAEKAAIKAFALASLLA
jgi:hypothetical protein